MTAWSRLEKIGSGSTGEVWRVQAPDGRFAALKQEHQHRSLKAEIAALAQLDHPHIPDILDADLNAEHPYLVMTLAEGEALNVLIATGALWEYSLTLRLDALASLADAVAHLHQRGLIHRDIKPSNMRGLAHPLLLDFGLACAIGKFDDPDAGTSAYMPPPGEPPSPAADRYAFAVSVYHLLFGAHPSRDHHRKTYQMPQDRADDAAAFASGDWRRPTTLPPSSIPGDLRGADLAGLEALFIPAFSAEVSARPPDLGVWMGKIRGCCGMGEAQESLKIQRTLHEVSVQEEILAIGNPFVGTPFLASASSISPSADETPFIPPPALPDFTAQQAAGFDDTRPPSQGRWWARFLARLQMQNKRKR